MAAIVHGKTKRHFVKITLTNGNSIPCRLLRANVAVLGRCVNCDFIPEEVYVLACRRTLCEQCFHARTEYICKVDNKKTRIERGVDIAFTLNMGLQETILECPWCRKHQPYRYIKAHITTVHAEECLGQEAQRPPLNKQLTDDSSSDTSLGESHHISGTKEEDSEEIVKCPNCISPLEISEMEEHGKTCPPRMVSCHVCSESITVKSYDDHMIVHYEEEQRKNAGSQKASDDGMVSKKDTEKHLETLKKKQMDGYGDDDPMVTRDIAEYIEMLKARQKTMNESDKRQDKLFSAIYAPTKATTEGHKDSRGNKNKSEHLEIQVTEPLQEDEDDEIMKKRREVAELKNRIKELEDRLEWLERPIQALIKRLSEEKHPEE